MTLAAARARTCGRAMMAVLLSACAAGAMLGAADRPLVLFLIGEPE